jgi:hypothetical protein
VIDEFRVVVAFGGLGSVKLLPLNNPESSRLPNQEAPTLTAVLTTIGHHDRDTKRLLKPINAFLLSNSRSFTSQLKPWPAQTVLLQDVSIFGLKIYPIQSSS